MEVASGIQETALDIITNMGHNYGTEVVTACLKILKNIIHNVLFHPEDPKYLKIRLNNPKVQEKITNVDGALTLLELSGFSQYKDDDAKENCILISSPKTSDELILLTEIWMIIQREICTFNNEDFKLPNRLVEDVQEYFKNNPPPPSFFELLGTSSKAKTVQERYDNFASAATLVPKFFEPSQGLDEYDTPKIVALLLDEQIQKINNSNNNNNNDKYTCLDIGCGWGNVGRFCSKHDNLNKCVNLIGIDASQPMLNLAVKNGYDRFHSSLLCLDVKKNALPYKDGTIDCIVSSNCLLQDEEIGHPSFDFFKEANRVLNNSHGFVILARRSLFKIKDLDITIKYALSQCEWTLVKKNRIRETFFLIFQKAK